jgi:hypothetical protein
MTPRLRSIQEARDECLRELALRRRCFDRWIAEGKISATDAQDRLDRMNTAVIELDKICELRQVPVGVTSSGDLTQPTKPS